MPQIIVTAGDAGALESAVALRERINTADFESERFTANLVERLAWAVSDASELERREPRVDELDVTESPRESEPSPELVEA